MNEKRYLHDLIASDRRNPTVNAYGPSRRLARYSSDTLPILDPVKNVATTFVAPVAIQYAAQPWSRARRGTRSPAGVGLLGRRADRETRVNNHNSMFGRDGRLWLAASVARRRQPCVLQGGIRSSIGAGLPDGPGH